MKNTARRDEFLRAIRLFKSQHGYSPSLRDLADMTDAKSLSVVAHYLKRLEMDGLIVRTSNISRSIEIVGDARFGDVKNMPGQRKWVSPETCEKRRVAAATGRSKNVFVPRPKKQAVAEHLKECFDAAVELAKENDAKAGNMDDVIRHNRWSVYHHVKAQKLG